MKAKQGAGPPAIYCAFFRTLSTVNLQQRGQGEACKNNGGFKQTAACAIRLSNQHT